MESVASLTQTEAEERAALIAVTRYDIAVDLRGLFEGEVLDATSTITFTCREPGAATFVDCVADIRSATLNGVALDPATAERGRLPLPDLLAENVLVVASSQSDTASAHGIQRTVDPSDKLVYLWTSLECDFARMLWANFDQPDLKAVHGFTVTAPETWTVLSNSASTSVEDLAEGGRLWTFEDTPPLSTYVTVVNAGPFYELRSRRGGYDLGLYCRQSLKDLLDRDAEELFELTEQGLAWFGEHFGIPFGQERYDHVFVPDLGGAMENWGCVTCGDWALPRSVPTYDERREIAEVVLHEMAHMWFGDLVTMRWWDDLWLNEAFASWAACWAAEGATRYRDGWAQLPRQPRSRRATASTWDRPPTRSGATSPTWRRRWRTSTTSPTPRARPCSSSSVRTPATTRSWKACVPTSVTTPGATRRSRTSSVPSPRRADRTSTSGRRRGSTAPAPTRSCSPATR